MNDDYTDFLTDITTLGNSLLLGTLALTLSIYLFVIGYRREPLAMMLGFFVPAAIIGFLKIAFYICDTNLWGIVSPSGHAAISIGVFGLAAIILAKLCTGIWRALIPLTLVALAMVIAVSRTILGMHTDGDVLIGSLIGVAVVIAIAKLVLSYRIETKPEEEAGKKKVHPAIICLLLIVVTVACYGIKLPSEKLMSSFAKQVRLSLPLCN